MAVLNRRQFLASAAATACTARRVEALEAMSGYTAARYSKAIVIDACGGMGEYDPSLPDDAPLTARGLADVRQSGVTVLDVTINPVGNGPNKFVDTVKKISEYEYEFNTHPDLMHVRSGADIQHAKSSKRLGIVYG